MHWQNGEWLAEDTAQAWDAHRDDLAWSEEAVAARRMRAAAEET
jgi:hypothetical protein